jgi:hypothetical protein
MEIFAGTSLGVFPFSEVAASFTYSPDLGCVTGLNLTLADDATSPTCALRLMASGTRAGEPGTLVVQSVQLDANADCLGLPEAARTNWVGYFSLLGSPTSWGRLRGDAEISQDGMDGGKYSACADEGVEFHVEEVLTSVIDTTQTLTVGPMNLILDVPVGGTAWPAESCPPELMQPPP